MTNSPKETSAEFASEMKQNAMMEEAIASAELAEEDTTPAWEDELIPEYSKLAVVDEDCSAGYLMTPAIPFIFALREEAVAQTVDYIYTNLPCTTDRMEHLVISKEKMREVLDTARGV